MLSFVQLLVTQWTAACQASLSITNTQGLLKLMSIQPPHLLSSPSPPAFSLSQHQGLFQKSVLRIRWPKYWSFSYTISPSNKYSGLISFRIDWLDLPEVQETLKIFSNTIVQKHQFFHTQLSSQFTSHIHT